MKLWKETEHSNDDMNNNHPALLPAGRNESSENLTILMRKKILIPNPIWSHLRLVEFSLDEFYESDAL